MMIAAVILAAGASRRMGRAKQLLPVDGRPMLLHVVETVLSARLDQVIVVLGVSATRIRRSLGGQPVTIVINADWSEGMASSLRAGLSSLSPDMDAALFVPADLPRLSAATIEAIVACFQDSGKSIVIPTRRGRRGNPVLFAHPLFPELMALRGDRGGRALFASHEQDIVELETEDDGILLDIDTMDDYTKLGKEST